MELKFLRRLTVDSESFIVIEDKFLVVSVFVVEVKKKNWMALQDVTSTFHSYRTVMRT